jgi:hypothetical protein
MRNIPHCGSILDFPERIVNDELEEDPEGGIRQTAIEKSTVDLISGSIISME